MVDRVESTDWEPEDLEWEERRAAAGLEGLQQPKKVVCLLGKRWYWHHCTAPTRSRKMQSYQPDHRTLIRILFSVSVAETPSILHTGPLRGSRLENCIELFLESTDKRGYFRESRFPVECATVLCLFVFWICHSWYAFYFFLPFLKTLLCPCSFCQVYLPHTASDSFRVQLWNLLLAVSFSQKCT